MTELLVLYAQFADHGRIGAGLLSPDWHGLDTAVDALTGVIESSERTLSETTWYCERIRR